ncbi:MAG: AMP-dependent synthetase, partial [Acetobacteraceae bacterium]
ISPFELESILIEHAAVAEAAVVPAPDKVRTSVPKAYVSLAQGWAADRETALAIFRHLRAGTAPYKRVRRIEFADLPKTISGKIRRVELRGAETQRARSGDRGGEFREEDFPELRKEQ